MIKERARIKLNKETIDNRSWSEKTEHVFAKSAFERENSLIEVAVELQLKKPLNQFFGKRLTDYSHQ
ncbi:MAG: hypothetical protein V3V31_05170 [Methylococcales bacterium]